MKALIALERLRMLRGRGLWLGLTLSLLIAAFGVAARHASGQLGAVQTSYDLGLSHLLAYLLPYLFCSGLIAEEVSGRTLGFLVSRPVPRRNIILSKWLVGAGTSSAVLAMAALVLHVGSYATLPSELVTAFPTMLLTVLSLSLQVSCYAALSLVYGALIPSAASALFAFHLLFLEAGLSLAPGPLRLLSMAHHSAELAGLPRHGILSESVRSLPNFAHIGALVVMLAGLLFAATSLFGSSEYRASEHD